MSEDGTVMVIDPDSVHFLRVGRLVEDWREWKSVDLGYAQQYTRARDRRHANESRY